MVFQGPFPLGLFYDSVICKFSGTEEAVYLFVDTSVNLCSNWKGGTVQFSERRES